MKNNLLPHSVHHEMFVLRQRRSSRHPINVHAFPRPIRDAELIFEGRIFEGKHPGKPEQVGGPRRVLVKLATVRDTDMQM